MLFFSVCEKQNGASQQGKDTILSMSKKAQDVGSAGTAVQVNITIAYWQYTDIEYDSLFR